MEKGLKTEFDIFGQDISPGSAFLIEASAGTGKTFNIQHLYLRLLLERGLEVGQILAVTFTEAATAELKNRIRNNLEKAFNMLDKLETEPKQCEEQDIILYNIILNSVKFARQNKLPVSPSENNIYAYLRRILRRSLICFDEAAIFTIHGFCSRMLNENAFESRVAYDLELVENQDDIIKELINDFWRKNFYGKNEKITKLLIEKNIYPENLMEFAELVISKPDMTLEHNLPDEILTKELSDELFLILFNNRLDALIASVSYEKKGKISKAIEILTQPHNEKDKMAVETIFEQLNSLKKNKNVKSLNKTFDSYLEECIELPLTLVRIFLREYLLTKLPEIKKSRRLQSYDDMLLNMREALKDENGKLNPHCELARKLRNKYKAVLIDEFQDTDPIQCQIFETIFRHKDCVYIMIGDPKQSIYKFRNADVYAYLAAKDKIEGNTKTLTENFRSRQEVLDGINELFSGERPFYNEKIPYTKITAGKNSKADEKSLILPENEKPFQLDWLDSEVAKTNIFDDVCEWTAYRIALSLSKYRWEGKKNGKISPSDIAVLVPKNSDALSIKNALKRFKIPAVISKSGNVFESEMAKEIYYLLHAILTPNRTDFLKAVFLGHFFNMPEEIFLDSDKDNSNTALADSLVVLLNEKFKQMKLDWEKRGIMPMLSAFAFYEPLLKDDEISQLKNQLPTKYNINHLNLSRTGVENIAVSRQINENSDSAERKIVDLRHLIELLHQAEKEQTLSPTALLNWLANKISDSDSNSDQDAEAYNMRLETDKDAVNIMTIHKSKGLEFPIVFCPFLYKKEYESKKDKDKEQTCHLKDKIILPLGASKLELENQIKEENLEELLRIAYVALTRATHFCCFVFGKIENNKSALRYLLANNDERANFISEKLDCLPPPELNSLDIKFVQENPVDASLRFEKQQDFPSLEKCSFERNIPKNRGLLSYSSIGKHYYLFADNIISRPTLPGGKPTGLCLHEILQELDFTLIIGSSYKAWSENCEIRKLIVNKMLKYGLIKSLKDFENSKQKDLYPAICEIIHNCLTANIPGIGKLNSISTDKKLAEIEFHYHIPTEIKKNEFLSIANEIFADYKTLKLSLSETQLSAGFMKGFIDLFFEKDGKYYFVDWKSDILPDYSSETICKTMLCEAYIFQYLIYSLAIHLYLKKRLKNYEIEKHFGGGLYIFLRGFDQQNQYGLWRHTCNQQLIERLEKCIL